MITDKTGIYLIESFQTSEEIHHVFVISSSYGQAAALRKNDSVRYLALMFERGFIDNGVVTAWLIKQIKSTEKGYRVSNFYSIAALLAALSIVDNSYAREIIDTISPLAKYAGFNEIGRLAESMKQFRRQEVFTTQLGERNDER